MPEFLKDILQKARIKWGWWRKNVLQRVLGKKSREGGFCKDISYDEGKILMIFQRGLGKKGREGDFEKILLIAQNQDMVKTTEMQQ